MLPYLIYRHSPPTTLEFLPFLFLSIRSHHLSFTLISRSLSLHPIPLIFISRHRSFIVHYASSTSGGNRATTKDESIISPARKKFRPVSRNTARAIKERRTICQRRGTTMATLHRRLSVTRNGLDSGDT